jgi:F-type H+-transporting ATPase subunit b
MDVITQLFENFGINGPKFAAQLILFVIVYAVLSKFAFAPVLAMLQERRRRIEEGQTNAEKIKRQLAEAELRYQEILRKANEDANALLEEARRGGEAISERASKQAVRDAEAIVAKAREAVALEHSKMVDEVRREMVRLVADTTAKVAGRVLTPEDQKRLNEETSRQLAA